MFRKILVATIKAIITLVLIYSAFVILFISTCNLLLLSVYMTIVRKKISKPKRLWQ